MRREIDRTDSKSPTPTHLVAFRHDDWIQTTAGWKLRYYSVVGEFHSPDQQSIPQPLPAIAQQTPANLGFTQGTPGEFPPGWQLGSLHAAIASAAIDSPQNCRSGEQCAILSSPTAPRDDIAFLYQVLDASQYRGKSFRLRALASADISGSPNVVRLLARVHTADGKTAFRDDMGRTPIISPAWTAYEIDGEIAPDARDLEFGVQLVGAGAVRIQSVSLDFSN